MSLTIYDATKTPRLHPVGGIYVLILGIVLLTWYVRGIGDAVHGDIRNFLPAFRSMPILTVVFAFLKLAGYVLFGVLFAAMVYAPVRNLWLYRIVAGTLEDVSVRVVKENKALLLVKLSGSVVSLRATDDLKNCLDQCAIGLDNLRIKVGAFHLALKVEKLPQ